MLPALPLRLRVSCLKWHRLESHRLLQNCQLHNGSRPPRKPPGPNARGGYGRWEKGHASVRGRDKGDARVREGQNLKLLEELFPEEAQRQGGRTLPERQVPRLALDLHDIPDILTPDLGARRALSSREMNLAPDKAASLRRMRPGKQGEVGLLVFRNASKNLTEDDFRRVIPQGKHIEGWNLDRGDIIKVVPGRDTTTLERQNFYFLLFKSPVSAFTYQSQVSRLHKISQSQTPNSLISPIPPPPGYMVGGEDIDALLQSYSLLPPSQQIELRQLTSPHSPSVAQIIAYRGYPAITARPDKAPVEVLLHLAGPQLTIPNIRLAFHRVARYRGMPWTGASQDYHTMNIRKWEVRGTNVSPMGTRRLTEYNGTVGDMDDLHDEREDSDDTHRPRRAAVPRYIVGFETDAEAQTFVRYWHRRPLAMPEDFKYENGDLPPIVNAEILW